MRTLTAFVLIAVALAGCSDEAPPETPDLIGVKDVTTDADTGAISGVVVDAAIVPVSSATVSLQTGENVITDTDGLFVFENLEPGTYFLSIEAVGYETTQSSTDVVAGKVSTPRIQLQPDLTPQPYSNTLEFKGHMVLSDFLLIYVVSDILGGNDLCQCDFSFQSDPGVQTVVLETYWTSSIDRVEEHDMYWDLWGGDGHDSQWVLSGDAWHVPGSTFGPDVTEWRALISSGEQPDVDQSFQGFITFWHLEPAPAGWAFGA